MPRGSLGTWELLSQGPISVSLSLIFVGADSTWKMCSSFYVQVIKLLPLYHHLFLCQRSTGSSEKQCQTIFELEKRDNKDHMLLEGGHLFVIIKS